MRNTASAVEALVCVGQSGINALATIRALGRRGVRVHALSLAASPQIASASRYCASSTRVAGEGELFGALLQFAAGRDTPAVLYVDNDSTLRALEPHAAELARRFRLVDPIAQASLLTDKRHQHRVASGLGIATPDIWFPRSHADIAALGGRGRLIAKPAPRHWQGAPADFKALVAQDGADLERQLLALALDPSDLIVQEYIEGQDSEVYVALCYRDGAGDTRVFSARKLRQTPLGAGVMAVGHPCDNPEVRDMTVRLAHATGIQGVLSTEFKLDRASGKYYFIEWNPRPGAFQSLGWRSGFDLAWIAYCDHAGLPLPGQDVRYDTGHHWINAQCEIANVSRLPSLALEPGSWRPYLGSTEWAVFALDDPAPWLKATGQIGRWVLESLARRLPSFGEPAPQSRYCVLSEAQALAFMPPEATEMRRQIAEAYRGGDLCVGVFLGQELTAWVWVGRDYLERANPALERRSDMRAFVSLGEVFGKLPSTR